MRKTPSPFAWIQFNDKGMVIWAIKFFWDKGILINQPCDLAALESGLDQYKSRYGNELMFLRNMKDAWRAVVQRKANQKKDRVSITHSISSSHNKQLRGLAEKRKMPINKTLESLIEEDFQKLRKDGNVSKTAQKPTRNTTSDILLTHNHKIEEKNNKIKELTNILDELRCQSIELLELVNRASSLFGKEEKKKFIQLTEKLSELGIAIGNS
ncbi:hypothetical protein [Shewanella mangrovisoli]|uniref:Uncharacterized protein n=1 Tax=Shewanella mangrovisoli TaxID=2864211 RepID=A0ABV4VDN9_9GAMM